MAAQPPSSGSVSKAAQGVLWSAGTSAAAAAATGSTVAGATAVSSMLAAAGVSVTVPVAGWIVAGGLLTAAGTVAIVRKFFNEGRTAAINEALRFGEGGIDFAREFADYANKPTAKLQQRQTQLRSRIASKQAATRSVGAKLRARRLDVLVDRLNANTILLAMRQGQVTQPAVAGDAATVPVVAAAQPDTTVDPMIWVAVGVGVLTLVAVATLQR